MPDIEVPPPGASAIVGRLLSEALREHPDVQWLGLMSEDGFAIASDGVAGVDDDAVAAGAVRMMVQVRSMARALGQTETSQLFLEGSDSGICVIDKDPWVLVMVGAPGVPIGLLRYEAREIAEAFPMGRQAQLAAGPAVDEDAEPSMGVDLDAEQSPWWDAEDQPQSEASWEEQVPPTPEAAWSAAEPEPAAEPELVPEIRWADEPTSEAPSGEPGVESPATDFADWSGFDAPAPQSMPGADEPVETSVAPGFALDDMGPGPDAAPSHDNVPDLVDLTPQPSAAAPAPSASGYADIPDLVDLAPPGAVDLADLAPPTGPAIDLPAPSGPAFELPPPE